MSSLGDSASLPKFSIGSYSAGSSGSYRNNPNTSADFVLGSADKVLLSDDAAQGFATVNRPESMADQFICSKGNSTYYSKEAELGRKVNCFKPIDEEAFPDQKESWRVLVGYKEIAWLDDNYPYASLQLAEQPVEIGEENPIKFYPFKFVKQNKTPPLSWEQKSQLLKELILYANEKQYGLLCKPENPKETFQYLNLGFRIIQQLMKDIEPSALNQIPDKFAECFAYNAKVPEKIETVQPVIPLQSPKGSPQNASSFSHLFECSV